MQNSNCISQYRASVQRMLQAMADCVALEDVIKSQGGVSIFVPEDFAGANSDLTPADFASIVSSRIAVQTWTEQNNHFTNLNKALN